MISPKEHFISRYKDGLLVQADYSQLEPSCQAQLSDDPGLIEDINNGIDSYCKYLALVLNENYQVVVDKCKTDSEWKIKRQKAKIVVLEDRYGAGIKKKAKDSGLSEDEVIKLQQAQKKAYPKLLLFNEYLKNSVNNKGYYKDPWGGLYYFKKYPSIFEWQISAGIAESYSPTQIKNYMIQGFASRLVLCMLGRFYREYIKYKNTSAGIERFCLINTIHDSIMLDCRPEYVELVKLLLNKVLTNIIDLSKMFNYRWKVPLKIEIKVGKTWEEL